MECYEIKGDGILNNINTIAKLFTNFEIVGIYCVENENDRSQDKILIRGKIPFLILEEIRKLGFSYNIIVEKRFFSIDEVN